MNRVSNDLGIVDDLLPPTGFEAWDILGNSLAIFVLCTWVNPFIIFPLTILLVLMVLGTRFYLGTGRQVKRLEAAAKSPLLNQMASTLNGLATIRSYGTEQMFIDRFSEAQNRHSATLFTFLSCSRLFCIYMEVLCLAFIVCLIVYVNVQLDSYSGSLIGLVISQALFLTDRFNWGKN